jgi:hypothetical protein
MNMLLHGIPHADIRQEDTLRRPQHKDDNGELKRYDRVLANPPFSQNYIKKDIEYPGRFAVWLPEKGKKADLMFVQHMLAVLKGTARWPPSCRTACCSAAARSARRGAISSSAAGSRRSSVCPPVSSTAPASPPACW